MCDELGLHQITVLRSCLVTVVKFAAFKGVHWTGMAWQGT